MVTATTQPTVLVGRVDGERQFAPVAFVAGQVVLTPSRDLVIPAEVIDCTKEVTLLLVAMQLDEVAETQFEFQDAPRTIA